MVMVIHRQRSRCIDRARSSDHTFLLSAMRGLSPTADRDETPMVSDSEDETEGFESEWEYETDSVKEASEYDEDVFFDAVSDNPYLCYF